MDRPTVFLSYSHKDEEWRNRISPHLGTLERNADINVEIWNDTKIDAGDTWYNEITNAMERASAAICLISANFLNSDFIEKEEVPCLLRRREQDGMFLLPILLNSCPWELVSWLKTIQMLPCNGKPITECYEGREDKAFNEAVKLVYERLKNPKPPPSSTPPPDRINTAQLPITGFELFGRKQEIKMLDEEWEKGKANIISFVANGGMGKSTLATKWLQEMASDNYRGANKVYAWSFYSQGTGELGTSADQFMADALKWFGDPNPEDGSTWHRGKRLAKLVSQERNLLILDGMERLQSAMSYERGRITDISLAALIRDLARENPGLCIITTREKVADLKQFPDTTLEKNLDKISDDAGRAILRVRRIEGSDAKLIDGVNAFGNHALAVNLLASYISKIPECHISNSFQIPDIDVPEEEGKHPRRVMEVIQKQFGEGIELELLRILGLFDRPADMEAIKALRKPPTIPGLSNEIQALSDDDWNKLLEKMRKLRLIAPPGSQASGFLDTHPLIREHFADELRKSNFGGWQKGQLRLYEFFRDKAGKISPNTPEGIALLLQEFYHAYKAGCYREAHNILFARKIHDIFMYGALYRWGQFSIMSDMAEELIKAFDDGLWHDVRPIDKYNLFVLAGSIYRKKGNLADAKMNYQRSLDMIEAEKMPLRYKVDTMLRMAGIYHHIGNFQEEMSWLNQAAHLGGNLKEKWKTRLDIRAVIAGRTGRNFMASGFPLVGADLNSVAIEYSILAENYEHVCSETFERGDAYLLANKLELAYKDYVDSREISRTKGRRDWEGEALRGIGNCHFLKGKYIEARNSYDEALAIAEETGYCWLEAKVYNAIAQLDLVSGSRKNSRQCAQSALKISEECGYKIQAAQAHIILSNLIEPKNNHIEKAREIVEETNDYWTRVLIRRATAPLYIVNNVVAKALDGRITIKIGEPEEIFGFAEAKAAANADWYGGQMQLLEDLREKGGNGKIDLTSETSSLRLGGGFLQVENTSGGKRIVMSKRRLTAQMRPGVLCESGGIHDNKDYILTMILELAEIARYEGETLYIPKLSRFYGYEERVPELLKSYNKKIEEAVIQEANGIGIKQRNTKYIDVATLVPDSPIAIKYSDGSTHNFPIYGEAVAELDSSSLEFIGIVEYDMLGLDVDRIRYQDTEREYAKPDGGDLRESLVVELGRDQVQCWPETSYKIANLFQIRPTTTHLGNVLNTIRLDQTGGTYANEKICAILKKLPSLGPEYALGDHFRPILD